MKKIDNLLDIHGTHVLIIGNRSYKNMGDELILAGTIKLLQHQGKKISIQAYDPKWLEGFLEQFVDTSDICFLREIPKGARSLLKFLENGGIAQLWKYKDIDAVIVGGGEILTEENPNSYWYWLVSLMPSLIRKLFAQTTIYLMGGIQIPKKSLNLLLFRLLLRGTTTIYARDFETIDTLKQFGYTQGKFFMDTAYFSWEWNTVKPASLVDKKHPYIVVNINGNGEHFLQEIIADITYYIEKGYHIYFVPVGKGKNKEYHDMKYAELLKKDFALEILDREKNFDHFLQILAGAEIVISTRLHLFLLASFLGTKTKIYPYQKKIIKMQNVLEHIFLER